MSGHKPWSAIGHRGDPARVAALREEMERVINRPWWRLVRLFDRLRSR